MKIEKVLLSLSLLFALCVTSFAGQFEMHKKGFNQNFVRENKNVCFTQPCQSEIFIFLGLVPDFKPKFKKREFDKFDFRRLKEDLSLEQQNKINQIEEASKTQVQNTMKNIKEKFNMLDEELSKDKYNKKTIIKLTEEISKLSDKQIKYKIIERQQIRDALTNEQYKKIVKKPGKYDRFAQKLDLSQEQLESVEKMFEANKEKMNSVKKDLMEKNVALEQEFAKKDADYNHINNLSNDIAELSKKKIQIIMDTKTELKKILTDEQFNKIMENRKCLKKDPIPVPKPVKPIVEEK